MLTKKTVNVKNLRTILVVAVFAVSFFMLSIGSAFAGLECPVGFGDCDCNGTCETDVLNDPNNCGRCGIVCESGECTSGFCDAVVPVLGGLIPCGRDFNDDTTSWNEKEDCTICHLIILTDNIIDYLLGLAGLVAILSLVIGGMLYVTSSGNSNLVSTAKTAFRKSLYGFVIVFIAWVATNTTMVLFGFDDPLGDGSWHKFDCDLASADPVINYYCGDGVVTNPNDDGIAEVCDPMEGKSVFIARTGLTAKDWVETIYACNPVTCAFGCVGDSNIGKGCYQPELADGGVGGTCQKGVYICDFSLAPPAVVCKNTYNNPDYKLAGDYCADVYDYCCRYIDDPTYTFADAQTDLNAISWTREKPAAASSGAGSFKCDNICKASGKVCVGVGLTDNVDNACVAVSCHSASNCTESANNVKKDCRTTYPFLIDSDSCTKPETYHVGYTSCLCF